MRGVSCETRGVLCALLSLILLAAVPAEATEPTGPVEVSARLVVLETASRLDHHPLVGSVEIEVDVIAREAVSDLVVRVLDSARNPIHEEVVADRSVVTLRVSLVGARMHELIVAVTAVASEGPVRDEIALRIPFGVPGFEPEDTDGIAAFPMEVPR